jgi:hypothetical protein
MTTPQATTLRGEARLADGPAESAVITLGPDTLWLTAGSRPPVTAGYRDIGHVGVDQGTVRLHLGSGPHSERWQLERFGQQTGALVKGLRNGRLIQRLADGLVDVGPDTEIDLVEYEAPGELGIAQLLYHGRGAVVAPVDDRHHWRRIRRADIGAVELEPAVGGLRVSGAGRSLPAPAGVPALRLLRLGNVAKAHADRWNALRDGAANDAAAIVAGLIPDADYGARRTAAALLLDGTPRAAAELGAAWAPLERAVLGHPPFDASYRTLVAIGGDDLATRWIAIAPERPGATDSPKTWFLVVLPGNLLALELVSEGAHATYLFRVVPRATYAGSLPRGALAAAVADVSEAMIDARFLREPVALPAARLAEAEFLRYRLALAALPTLAAARTRFVARLVHADPATWEAALRDAIAWHQACRDDAAEWPGRAAQETQVAGIADAGTLGG